MNINHDYTDSPSPHSFDSFFDCCLTCFRDGLPVDESFDLLERRMTIGGRRAVAYFVDGLTDGYKCQLYMAYLMQLTASQMEGVCTCEAFLRLCMPFMDANSPEADSPKTAYEKALPKLYSGLVPLLVEGLDGVIIIDCRDYPNRSIQEPDKEKSLRGAKDGFTESMMTNVALIRRRIKDNHLIFKSYCIGTLSKADVSVAYMNDRADEKTLARIQEMLQKIGDNTMRRGTTPHWKRRVKTGATMSEGSTERTESRESTESTESCESAMIEEITAGDESLLESLQKAFGVKGALNPFPKVRYSQRPDVVAAHICEGRIAIVVDNSPSVMMIPVSFFEFFQDVDDYYFPQLTGNYFRFLRMINFMVILFLTPLYLLLTQYGTAAPDALEFFLPKEIPAIPVFWQFILLEVAIDALKLASLNTPTSLGMSLSVIGALLLGEFSIDSGWLISQTILCMAVVALAAFTQPNMELAYAIKFWRIFILIGTATLGEGGLILGVLAGLLVLATTKTLSGDSYLYPLFPYNKNALKRLIFRTQKW